MLANRFNKLEETNCEYLTIAFWVLWSTRNKIYHQGEKLDLNGVTTFIRAYKSKNKRITMVTSSFTGWLNIPWSPPSPGMIKCNFDASFNLYAHTSIFGILFRNDEGRVMALCTYQNKDIGDANMAEAKACLQAITMAKDLGFRNLSLEGDSLTVIKKTMKRKWISRASRP